MAWYNWSQTANNNATADSSINWAEGQSPSSINDSARAMMAATAKYRDDIAGAIVTGGTSTNYTLNTFSVFDSLAHMDKQMVAFTPHVTNGPGPILLNTDALGLKPLRSAPGAELPSGSLILGTPYVATYNNTDGAFYLQGGISNPYNIPLGGGMDYWLPTAPNSAFVFPAGQAISRTTYATLFAAMGTTFGAGDGSTTFNIPDVRGRFPQVSDNMGGTSAGRSYIGFNMAGGSYTATLTTANLPAYTPTGTNSGGFYTHPTTPVGVTTSGGVGASVWQASADRTDPLPAQPGFTGAAQGGTSTPFSILPPTLGCNYILRIV
jgi:microcystin-dependent protein